MALNQITKLTKSPPDTVLVSNQGDLFIFLSSMQSAYCQPHQQGEMIGQ